MTSNPHRQALFVKADGGPMYFYMVPCSERREIGQLIENGGGVLLRQDKNPDVVRLVPSSITTTEGPDDAFAAHYIRDCVHSNKLLPLKNFILPRVPAAETDGDRKVRKLHSVRSRREYTLEEEVAMAKYIGNKPNVRVRGNAIYKEMAAACAVPGDHPWQSLRQHYLKKILPMKHLYESLDGSEFLRRYAHESLDARELVKRYAHKAQEAHDAPPSATSDRGKVLVEDNSSDDELFPKPRGATDGGVEKKPVRLRREYTLREQIAMARYIANKPNVRVRGNAIYKEMAAACAVPGDHPWQSLKQHYLKKILPLKHLYKSLDGSEFSKRYAHESLDAGELVKRLDDYDAYEAQEARDGSPSAASERGIVLVEDSNIYDELFPKPRKAADVEVGYQNLDTKIEVIEETVDVSNERLFTYTWLIWSQL
ncbi:telomeric repeat-binding factor 2-interacting protein 1-like [Dermacentor albipictus]|uniref:telomeric repeat-binding factor 2-interacting protein 1-like n=1 Tax=Dermacentor albipictus TaxID=60249 RepID=UPI0038FC012D